MRVLMLGINYPPEKVGIAVYSGGLAVALAERGIETTIVTAKPYYPGWRVFDSYRGFAWRRTREAGVDVVRCPLYVPRNPTGARRIIHHLTFALSALVPMLVGALRRRPDVVFTAAPSLIASPVALLAARLTGAKAILHIQDFEVEAAFATGLINGAGWLARAARRFERFMMRRFDIVSSISPEMCGKLSEIGVAPDRVVEFRNWSDIERVRPLAGPSPYRAEWGIATPNVALYSGNIANKQGIEVVVDAARLLAHRNDLTFVVCGDGPMRAALESRAGDLENILFRDLQPVERLSDLMGLATIHLLPQKAGAADLLLPSKLTNMLASGRPVVATAAPGTGLAREVKGCGVVTAPEEATSFAEAIARLADEAALRDTLGRAARARAEQVWDRRAIIDRFVARLEAPSAG